MKTQFGPSLVHVHWNKTKCLFWNLGIPTGNGVAASCCGNKDVPRSVTVESVAAVGAALATQPWIQRKNTDMMFPKQKQRARGDRGQQPSPRELGSVGAGSSTRGCRCCCTEARGYKLVWVEGRKTCGAVALLLISCKTPRHSRYDHLPYLITDRLEINGLQTQTRSENRQKGINLKHTHLFSQTEYKCLGSFSPDWTSLS